MTTITEALADHMAAALAVTDPALADHFEAEARHPFAYHSPEALDAFVDAGDFYAGSICALPGCGASVTDATAHTDARALIPRGA